VKDYVTFALIVGAFVVGGSLLLIFELLPEDRADEFHALSAGNMTLQSEIITIKEPTAEDDTRTYAINKVAAEAVAIAQNDPEVKEILQQVRGNSITIAGVQPTLLIDSSGDLIHSSAGQVVITANQERIEGKLNHDAIRFETFQGKRAEARQQIWTILIDIDRKAVQTISKEPERRMQSDIQPNFVHAGMNMFMPHAIIVEPGTTVRWFNDSSIPHNVVGTYLKNKTSDRVQVDSGFFERDRSFQYTFDDAGTLEYRCTIHSEEGMKGLLVIAEK
jgi:plastocyanin